MKDEHNDEAEDCYWQNRIKSSISQEEGNKKPLKLEICQISYWLQN